MPAPATIDDFLDVVRKSKQIDNDRLTAYLDQHRQGDSLPPDPRKLAVLMIREGLITAFQAEQFLQGKYKGFHLGGYRLIERLGTGGTGTVYLAEHEVMRRRVAIKVLPPQLASDPATLERFRREAQAAAALDHPNIARAFDFRQEGLLHFLVMEYINGPSLQDVLQRQGALSVEVACEYVRQAALGLEHAHDAGLVHRDIKPANLLIDGQGVVKILDLGLARFAPEGQESVTRQFDENMVMGTADYLSPEQGLNLHAVDHRADIYSLGSTLYALLAGEPPFHTGTVTQKLLWHQMRDPKPLRQRRPDVPEAVAEVVEHMMAKSPDDRYQSAAEVAEALEPFSAGPTPQAPNAPALESGSQAGGAYARTSGGSSSKRHKPPRPAHATPPIIPSTALATQMSSAEEEDEDVPITDRPLPDIRKPPVDSGRVAGIMVLGGVMTVILLTVVGVIGFLVWGPQPSSQVASTVKNEEPEGFEARFERDKKVAQDPVEPPAERAHAIGRLAIVRRLDTKPIFITALSDGNASVRAAAATALGDLGDAGAIDLLIGRLKDGDVAVRQAVVRALGALKAKKAIGPLVEAAGNEATQHDAITALAQMPDRQALPAYLVGLASANPTLRQNCRQALTPIRHEVAAALEELFKRGEIKPTVLAELRVVYQVHTPVLTWALVGPFFDTGSVDVPVNEINLDAVYKGAGRPVKWLRNQPADAGQNGRLRLDTRFSPRDHMAAYGYAEINSDREREAELLLGSDDSMRVWVNGQQVFTFNDHRSWKFDENRVKVKLQKGKNTLLVRCGNVSGPWEFSVGVSDDLEKYPFLGLK
jgi:serine/threonine protein kinase